MNGMQIIPEHVLSARRQRWSVTLPEHLSDDEIIRDWSLSTVDLEDIRSFKTRYGLLNALQLCTLRHCVWQPSTY